MHFSHATTGVFWKPVYNVLEGQCALLVVNAAHMRAVPGRKTDVKDAEWIADLLRHGLLRTSYVPSRAERELRELVRYRKSLIRERAAEVNSGPEGTGGSQHQAGLGRLGCAG